MALPARISKRKTDTGRPQRQRSPAHLAFVRTFHCIVPGCEDVPIEAAHIRVGTVCGMGQKPDDWYAVACCREHHSEMHRIGERSFAAKHGVNLIDLAQEFCAASPAYRRFLAKKAAER